jgi:hypothetical protein
MQGRLRGLGGFWSLRGREGGGRFEVTAGRIALHDAWVLFLFLFSVGIYCKHGAWSRWMALILHLAVAFQVVGHLSLVFYASYTHCCWP